MFAGRQVAGRFERPVSEAVRPQLASTPGVASVDGIRIVRQRYRDQAFMLASYDLESYRRHNKIPVVSGDVDAAMPELTAGTAVMASEAFIRRFNARLGDTVTLQTLDGPRDFKIALVYTDFTSELGILTMTHHAYVKYWRDPLIDVYWVHSAKGTPVDTLRERIAATSGSATG